MHGSKVDFYKMQELKGRPSPLNTKPEADNESLTYINAYYFISHFRQPGMSGVGPLNLSDIIIYYNEVEAYGEQNEFIRIMMAIDIQFMSYHHKEQQSKSKAAKPKRQ